MRKKIPEAGKGPAAKTADGSGKQAGTRIDHPIPPLYDGACTRLILGSFPSVKSREAGFFYGHPQNRFWKVMAGVFKDDVPRTVPEKRDFLLRHHVAVWDVIASCEITGSSDASIKNARANDLSRILAEAPIRTIFVNGKTAEKLYLKHILPVTGQPCVCLPSTSPANAAWSPERLTEAWRELLGVEGEAGTEQSRSSPGAEVVPAEQSPEPARRGTEPLTAENHLRETIREGHR